ncbi:MAG TPA: tetratricopeptide repeat protein [Ktedonobacteraceae bacterium]|nr:tetratricopeptide repeat protein [Ktedonobacteraceae bacterium]
MKQINVAFPALLSQLDDPDSQVRLQTIKDIMSRPAERGRAFASLLGLLNDPDERVLKAVIQALGTLRNGQVAPVLGQLITHHPISRVRLRALRALVQINQTLAKPHMLVALKDASPLVRRAAVGILARWRDPHALPSLLPLLADSNAAVRASAGKAVKSFGGAQAADVLLNPLPGAEASNRRGNAFRALGLYEQAEADFTQAIQLEPDWAEAYQNRGLLYTLNFKRHEQAIDDFQKVIQLWPERMRGYFERGSVYVRMQQYTEAIPDLDRVILADQEHALTTQAHLNRGIAHMHSQAYQQALEDFEQVLEFNSGHIYAYNNRGCVYHLLEDYQQSINEFTRAVELNPAYALGYSNRGELYQCTSQFDQAIVDFEFALLLDPDLRNTRQYLEKARNGEKL